MDSSQVELEKWRRLQKIGKYAFLAFSLVFVIACVASTFLFQEQNPHLIFKIILPLFFLLFVSFLAWNAYVGMKWMKIFKESNAAATRVQPVRCEIYGIENPHYRGDIIILPQQLANPEAARSEVQVISGDQPPPYHQVVASGHKSQG